MQQRHPPYASGRIVTGIVLTSLWHFPIRTVHYHATGLEHSFAMGSHFFLHLRNELSGYGYESCIARISLPVSFTALFPNLRQFGTQRLSSDLCMAFGSGTHAVHAIALLHPEKIAHRVTALCIYPLKQICHERKEIQRDRFGRHFRPVLYLVARAESGGKGPRCIDFLYLGSTGIPITLYLYIYERNHSRSTCSGSRQQPFYAQPEISTVG